MIAESMYVPVIVVIFADVFYLDGAYRSSRSLVRRRVWSSCIGSEILIEFKSAAGVPLGMNTLGSLVRPVRSCCRIRGVVARTSQYYLAR